MATVPSLMFKGLKKAIREAIWKRLDLRWPLPSGIELEVACKSDWYIYNEVFVDLDYDAPIRAALASAKGTTVFFDLGANVGFFGLRWLHLAAELKFPHPTRGFFIEAGRQAHATLSRRLGPHSGGRHQLTFLHRLAGKKSGSAMLNLSPSHFGNSLLGGKSAHGTDEVSFEDLDVLAAPFDSLDLIKCDIEGSEQIFLETYPDLLRKTRRLVMELHTHLVDIEHCEQLIRDAGFTHRDCLKERPEFRVVHYWKD